LLKTLEEPPGHIKFLLATTDPQKLPATILSRVQRHNFQLVPLGKIVARLREIASSEGMQISDGALALVGRQAAGAMRDALSLLDQLFSAHDPARGEIGDAEAAETLGALDTSVVRDIVAAVLSRDAAAALQGVVRAYEQGADFKRLAEDLAAQARNLVLAGLHGVKQDLPDHEIRALAQEAQAHDSAQLARVFELLQLAQDEVAKAATPRHALEVALLRAVHLSPAGSLPELVARVEQLSRSESGVRKVTLQAAAPLRATDSLQDRWRLLLDAVKAARKPAAASALEHGVPLKIDRSGVQIGFRKGDARAAIIGEVKADIEGVFEKALGYRAPLQLVEQEAANGTVAAENQQKRAQAQSGRITQGREHPAVKSAVELLGGEIEDVRDLGEE